MALNAKGLIAAGRLLAAQKVPYLASVLVSLVPRECRDIPTMAVTKHALMLYNPDFVERQTPAAVGGCLVHECFHLILQHHARFEKRQPHDVANIAQDLSINPVVVKAGLEFPKSKEDRPLFPADYKLPDGETAEWYFGELMKMAQQNKQPQSGHGVGAGHCGSCAANPVEGEPEDGGSKDPAGRSQAEMDGVRRAVAAAIQEQSSRQRGTFPAELARWAETFLAPPRVRWQDKLARRARSQVAAARAGLHDYSYARPDRRSLSTWKPGQAILPDMDANEPRCGVAFDTSGSMGADALGLGLREARGVLTAAGMSVEVLACDAAVHSVQSVKSWRQILPLLKGGGGTSFLPIFEEVVRPQRRGGRLDILVYITDGYGDWERVKPPRGLHVIWLITPGGAHPAPFGETIVMEV